VTVYFAEIIILRRCNCKMLRVVCSWITNDRRVVERTWFNCAEAGTDFTSKVFYESSRNPRELSAPLLYELAKEMNPPIDVSVVVL
jgi:hypothetical protein